MASRYKYSKLDHKKRQIRLLHLHPLDLPAMEDSHAIVAADDIHCSFSVASLDDEPSYEALSYVWGTAEAISLVLLQDDYLPVTKHLETILKHLRQDTERVLWIDALCIDQSNIDEHSQQVSQMHNVFSQASQVLVYLGEAWDGIDSTLELMAFAGNRLDLHWDSIFNKTIECEASDARSASQYNSVARYFSSQWWTRVWTIQEYVLAKNATFMRGRSTLDAPVFNQFLGYCIRHGQECCKVIAVIDSKSSATYKFSTELFFRAHMLRKVADSSTWRERGFLPSFVGLRSRVCLDPHDKIYGMLGILPTALRTAIPIDYKRSTRDVYRDVVVAALKKNFMPLSLIDSNRDLDLELPSWVLDFSASIHEKDNKYQIHRLACIEGFCASQNSVAQFIYTGPDKAAVRAIAVDRINNIVHRPMDFDRVKGHYVAASYAALAACEASAGRYASIIDAFWQTLLGGVSANTAGQLWYREIFDKGFEVFEKWLNWIETEEYQKTGDFIDMDVSRFHFMFAVVTVGRNFTITEKGYIGWVPENAKQGDVVMLFSGGNVPYILRPVDQTTLASSPADSNDCSHLYKFCGDAYIHGIMHGEAYDETKLQDISLI
ncbi:hypothetical protein E8E13_002094 [Curvularia kusanoi]|uniref:Heterokaryon incompatibility domain-containing protein n=1 Tax=Curvularia kusanoi TaxID=90978 RepID=A0A9P4WDY0_CURKU|nr:hypothetical protein E8E13_002094 [Curvularia kusanoi]